MAIEEEAKRRNMTLRPSHPSNVRGPTSTLENAAESGHPAEHGGDGGDPDAHRAPTIGRRALLGGAAVGGLALCAPRTSTAAEVAARDDIDPALWIEATIPEL